jgi:hypothetical protein
MREIRRIARSFKRSDMALKVKLSNGIGGKSGVDGFLADFLAIAKRNNVRVKLFVHTPMRN